MIQWRRLAFFVLSGEKIAVVENGVIRITEKGEMLNEVKDGYSVTWYELFLDQIPQEQTGREIQFIARQLPRGIEDHFPDEDLSAEELIHRIQERFAEWGKVMSSYAGNDMGASAEQAGAIEIDMHHLYHLTEHTGYHLGQIIDRAKRLSGQSFQFCQNGINEKALKSLIESAE